MGSLENSRSQLEIPIYSTKEEAGGGVHVGIWRPILDLELQWLRVFMTKRGSFYHH
jgi:hypothetical protein